MASSAVVNETKLFENSEIYICSTNYINKGAKNNSNQKNDDCFGEYNKGYNEKSEKVLTYHHNNNTNNNNNANNNKHSVCLERKKLSNYNNSKSALNNNYNNYYYSLIKNNTFYGLVAAIVIICCFNRLQLVQAEVINYESLVPHTSKEFSKHAVIRPTIQSHDGRSKRDLSSTRSENDLHPKQITVNYEFEGKDVILDLKLNDNLIPKGHFMRYQTPNGDKVIRNFTQNDIDLCHYKGRIRNNEQSRVAISTCNNGIKGIIIDDAETYYIDSPINLKNASVDDDHIIYRHSDMIQNTKCGYEGGINKTHDIDYYKDSTSAFNRLLRYKRSSDETTIRGPYNANKHSSFVELVLVVDNKVYKNLNENLKKVHSYCKDIANIINALYVPLNIFIALSGIVVWNESNDAVLSNNGDTTLKNFLEYRRKVLVKNHPNDNAQLLTKETFEGGVVGKALKGPICTYEFSGGVSMDHSTIISVVATTVAHEMGHNFGMEHDSPDCKCKDERCIMSASSSNVAPLHWSSCSIDQLNMAFHQGMNYCLRNKPTNLFDSPQCGNGFVEPGEQCDCGLPKFCENSCCDPYTCMLHTNASCATGECCDLTTCHPRTAGTVCRTADGECDLPEYCTGESEYCPSDYFKRDTEICDNGKAYCYEGSCRSHTDQCKILWGPSGKTSEECYIKNLEGTRHGNCGYDRLLNTYLNCTKQDILCGMLQCRHLNERLEFGMESVSVLSHSFISRNAVVIPCRTAIVDMGLQSIDPGLTPDGARCGENQMCVKQKCLSLDTLRTDGVAPTCPDNCSGHGTCNNKGHCFCEVGFAPPLCNSPGPGGSEFGGPATNPNENGGIARILYVFFLGVVPFIAILLLVLYYWRHNRLSLSGLRKPSNVFKSTVIKQNNQHRGNGSAGGGGGDGSTSPSGGKTSTPSSTDDMNSSLLKSDDPALNNNIPYGRYKGYTLKPLPTRTPTQISAPNVAFVHPVSKSVEQTNGVLPNRTAPPVPKPPNVVRSQTQVKSVKPNINRTNSTATTSNEAPALPPLNPGATARPLISSPILENSTCTAKELISPLRHNAEKYSDKIPIRPAPAVPKELSAPPAIAPPQKSSDMMDNIRKATDGTIKRITSFLQKKEDKSASTTLQKNASSTGTLPRQKNIVIDKEKLKTLEISAPIEATENKDGQTPADRSSLTRTQSLRDPSTTNVVKRPNIQTFGSMRHPAGSKRPGSMIGSRPKSPPPPRPPAPPSITSLKIPGVPGYQNPPEPKKVPTPNVYDDCEAIEAPLAKINEDLSPTNSDNIYSVIDEYQRPNKTPVPAPLVGSVDSSGGDGLLGEICNEIENRNFDSIYSVSTLKRKKDKQSDAQTYQNTADITSDYGENEYLNMKSNASTTSSGYLRPTAINAPIARVAPVKPEKISGIDPTIPIHNNLSSFKSKNVEIDKIVNKNEITNQPTSSIFASKYSNNRTTPTPTAQKSDRQPISWKSTASPMIAGLASVVQPPAVPSSPPATTKKPLGGSFNRTKTPPSIQTTNSIRTRSPSPSSATKPVGKLTAKPGSIIKTNDTVNNKTKIDSTKPKPLTKPQTNGNISTEIIPKDNKTTTAAATTSVKPKWQSTKNNITSTTPNRPTLAKNASNVASLQQRFETGSNVSGAAKISSAAKTTLKK